MANLCVSSTGSNTSPFDTWAKAATSLANATATAVSGDKIFVSNTFAQTGLATTTYTVDGVELISTSDTTNVPPLTYATGASVATTTSGGFNINGGTWRGFSFLLGSGSNAVNCAIGSADNHTATLVDCNITFVATGLSSRLVFGVASASGSRCNTYLRNVSVTWANSSQGINANMADVEWIGGSVDAGATHPTSLFKGTNCMFLLDFEGVDFSANSGTLFPAQNENYQVRLVNCLLNASATIQATQSSDSSGEVFIYDSDSGNNHYKFAHYSYRGTTVAATSRYVTADGATYDGTNRHSLTITGLNATSIAPYYSPWIDAYTAGGSSVTPYFEIARDGSSTAYQDNQVWGEFLAKTTASSTQSTFYKDRTAVLGTPANQAAGTGTGNWTGLGGTSWSGKVDSGVAITPQVIGYMRGRLAVATNDTVYLDPRIRGI